jgi:3-hydroxybutyryl-CoA dehydrogenase
MAHSRPVVAIVGMGTMGCGIAVAALTHDIDVRLIDVDDAATVRGMDRLSQRLDGHARGGLIELDVETALRGVVSLSGLRDVGDEVDLIIEAVPESWQVKREVLTTLSASTSAVIATNTSAFPVDELAASVDDAARFLGVHFFNPAEWIPGVEVVPGRATSASSLASAFAVLHRMAKVPTLVSSSPGFLANRLQLALFAEASRCLDEGLATAEEIDRVVRTTFGFRLSAFGPFAIADMAGLDVYLSILETLSASFGERFEASPGLRTMVAQGRFGTKSGGGFADYEARALDDLIARRDAAYSRLMAAVSDTHPGVQDR